MIRHIGAVDAREYRLGVDFGTSNTVGMLRWPDGRVRPLLFDGSPTLPSAVYADPDSGLLTGRDAVRAARVNPERFEPNPKRRVDEPAVLLGDVEFPIVDLVAAVLSRVAGEARRVAGGHVGPATITYPAAWAQTRRGVLMAAAERAGLGQVSLVPEPVAAAGVFMALGGAAVPAGSAFVVYDLGAGTFDASVVRQGPGGFDVLAAEGLSESGGLDIDAAIVASLGEVFSTRDPEMWSRLAHPGNSNDRRASRLLWDDVRAAKEMLSRTSATMMHIPLFDQDAPLGRSQFEQLARPILDATVTATRVALAAARLTPADISGVFLVGGGSRIPLVSTLLHQALGMAPTVVEQPELVVAQGSLGGVDTLPPAGFGAPAGPVSAPPLPSAVSAPPMPYAVSAPPSAAVSGPPSSVGGYTTPAPYAVSAPPAVSSVSAPPDSSVSAPPGSSGSTPPVFSGSAPAVAMPSAPSMGRASVAPPRPPSLGYGGPPAGPGAPQAPQAPAAGPARSSRLRIVIAAVAVVVLLAVGLGAYGLSQLGGEGTKNPDTSSGDAGDQDPSNQDPSDTGNQVTVEIEHPLTDWVTTAAEYEGQPDKAIAFNCPKDGSIGTVWGSEPYTTDSSVCTAAVHAGWFSLEDGGRVIIVVQPGQEHYDGTTRFGIVTTDYDAYPWCFTIVG